MGESKEHYLLKQIGFGMLLQKGCYPVGIEVELPFYEHNLFSLGYDSHHICDVAGIAQRYVKRKDHWSGSPQRIKTIYAIEVKVSKEDFRAGFCTNGWGKLWILAPPNIVPVNELPGGVGLYECNLKRKFIKLTHRSAFSGYELSEVTEKRMIDKMVWGGYQYSIKRRLEDYPIIREIFKPTSLDDFYEPGEDRPSKPEEEEVE